MPKDATPPPANDAAQADKGATQPPPADEPLTLTKAELQKLIDDNRAEAEQGTKAKWEAEQAKQRQKAEEEEARKRGEWEKLAQAEKLAREEAERRAAAAQRSELVNDALVDAAAEHEGYSVATFRKYVKPLVMAGLPDDARPEQVAKVVKERVAEYVKDNPRQVKGAGAPPPPAHGARLPAADKPQPAGANGSNSRRLSVMGGM